MSRTSGLRSGIQPVVLSLWALTMISAEVRAERPTAPALLPEKTLAFLRIPDTREFVAKFKESSMGRMLQDEQIKPLAKHLYGSAAAAFGQVQDQVGLPLENILAIPQGELCIALVAPKEGPPALVALLEVGDQLPAAQTLLDRAVAQMERQGANRTTQDIGDTLLITWDFPGERRNQLAHCIKQGVLLFASNVEVARQVLAAWDGQLEKDTVQLAENRKFTAVMNRCLGTRDERPQVMFYADPIELVRTASRGNFAAQTGLAILPALGLDGLQAVGGSMILATEDFDAIQHLHLLLESPRSGVLKAIALESGDAEPEPWVPGDVANYMTLHWNADTTYREIARLVDSFQTEGATDQLVKERFSERLGIDARKELIEALEGRITYFSWFEPPARINSQAHLVALKLKDAAEFRGTLDRVIQKFESQFTKQSFGGVSYHLIKVPEGRRQGRLGNADQGDRPNQPALELREPEPCVAILGDYLVLTGSTGMLRHCIAAQNDSSKSLANELDFKLITSKIKRQVGGQTPALITFNRPEEGMRLMYDLAQSENTRRTLSGAAQNNPVLRALNEALETNPLPPFAVLAQYLAPGGGMMTSDETGFHYTAFGLKRK